MKIVLFGPDGQLGWELRRSLAALGTLIVLPRGGSDASSAAACGDLAQPERLAATLRALRPDVVVNAAAFTAVDLAESQSALAHQINAEAVGVMAQTMAELGGWLLHYSTDYVFDGSGHTSRDESAATAPLNVYGHSKLAGEALIRASGCQHLILRTSWVHSARGGNFARTMLRLAGERDSLNVIADQIGAPTGADLLADVSAHVLRAARLNPALAGTYHAVAAGEVSWFDYARHVIGQAQRHGMTLRCGPDQVQPIASSAYPTPAARPLNSRLNTQKLRSAFGLTLPDWRDGVDRMLAESQGWPAGLR